MKTTLILPPTGQMDRECFPLPNMSLPVLAGHLRREGVQVAQLDLAQAFQDRLRGGWKRSDFKILGDSGLITAYLRGSLPAGEASAVREVEERLFGLGKIERSGLFGISLVNLKLVFNINSAALIANRIKKLYGAPVAVGDRFLSSSIYGEILSRYPVFDYAVYDPRGGEAPLLALVRRLEGDDRSVLSGTLERLPGGGVKDHPAVLAALPECTAPDYRGYPLDRYTLTGKEILSSYNCGYPVFRELLGAHGKKKQLIVTTRFETTCRAKCIFCNIRPDSESSDRRSTSAILAELAGLKARGATGLFFLNCQFNNLYEEAEALCDGMIKSGLGLQWCDCVNFRELDEELLLKMKDSGAVMLTFGMETGSPRLLNYIRKGVRPERISRLLRFSHSIGIWNNIELIGGLPTETEADVRATEDFIEAHRDVIDVYSLNPFYLPRVSPLYRRPGTFGIRLRPSPGPREFLGADDVIHANVDSFDEMDGPAWEDKSVQIETSTRRLAEAIERASPPVNIEGLHIDLLMYLYGIFGHEKKGLIRKLMRTATALFKPCSSETFVRSPSPLDYLKGRLERPAPQPARRKKK